MLECFMVYKEPLQKTVVINTTTCVVLTLWQSWSTRVHGIQKLRLLTILLPCVYAVELAYLIPTAPSLKLSAL